MSAYVNQRRTETFSNPKMAAASVDRAFQDDLTKLRLRMLGEKLQHQRNSSRLSSESSEDDHPADQAQVRLHRAMLKRDDLLERLRKDRYDPSIRPRSLRSEPPARIVQPPPRPPSLPEMKPVQYQPIQPIQPVLPPIQTVAPPNPSQPIYQVIQPPQVPAQHNPFGKGDFMEMMMMQNAQMHQMVMNQMMMSSMPNAPPRQPQIIRLDEGGAAGGGGGPIILGGGRGNQTGRGSPAGGVVHHHHYQNPPQPAASPLPLITHLPPLDFRRPAPPPPPPQPIHVIPREIEPLKQPKVRVKPKMANIVHTPRKRTPPKREEPEKAAPYVNYPYPGSKGMRKLRYSFYAAFLVAAMRNGARKKRDTAISDVFIFGIYLKEAVAALHRIYLHTEGKIYPILRDAITVGSPDFSQIIEKQNFKQEQAIYKELQYVIENITFHITEIMPTAGVLGTHKKSVVYEMIKNGKKYPKGYFWNIEKSQIEFDADNRTRNVTNNVAFLFMVGVYISRALVTTLLMKPVDYGLVSDKVDAVAQRNLSVLSTVFLYIVRKVSVPQGKPMLPMPTEVSKYLYRDDDMKRVYTKMKNTIEYSEGLLRKWGTEYVKRLRQAQQTDPNLNEPTTIAGATVEKG